MWKQTVRRSVESEEGRGQVAGLPSCQVIGSKGNFSGENFFGVIKRKIGGKVDILTTSIMQRCF